jgi:hypothetical protein
LADVAGIAVELWTVEQLPLALTLGQGGRATASSSRVARGLPSLNVPAWSVATSCLVCAITRWIESVSCLSWRSSSANQHLLDINYKSTNEDGLRP